MSRGVRSEARHEGGICPSCVRSVRPARLPTRRHSVRVIDGGEEVRVESSSPRKAGQRGFEDRWGHRTPSFSEYGLQEVRPACSRTLLARELSNVAAEPASVTDEEVPLLGVVARSIRRPR